jgi:hypothetical protein
MHRASLIRMPLVLAAGIAFPDEVKVVHGVHAVFNPIQGHRPLVSSTIIGFEKYSS